MTTPEINVIMSQIVGIVAEEGGQLCHAAIAAREFKKPTILIVRGATKLIKTGDLIELDANNGIVRKL